MKLKIKRVSSKKPAYKKLSSLSVQKVKGFKLKPLKFGKPSSGTIAIRKYTGGIRSRFGKLLK